MTAGSGRSGGSARITLAMSAATDEQLQRARARLVALEHERAEVRA
jgi:hypothetical protein